VDEELVVGPHYRGIRAVLFLPDAVAHNSHPCCALLIISFGQKPAHPRLYTEGSKEVSGDVFSVSCIRLRL
jgi:hypothetical protein